MLTCKELTRIITEYLEGTMPWRERVRFRTHILMCRHCRAYLEQMRQTIAACGHLEPESVSPEAREVLLQAFRAWSR